MSFSFPSISKVVNKYNPIKRIKLSLKARKEISKWERLGCPLPPPHIIKQRNIISLAKKYDLKILVETGTYLGDMVNATKGKFKLVYSVELSEFLYNKAKIRFQYDNNVVLFQGDSAVELGNILKLIDAPTIFWLDGHYSSGVTAKGVKDTPIYEELTHLLNNMHYRHVIVIDDARCFGTDPSYPSLDELSKFIKHIRPNITIELKNDSIILVD